MRYFKNHKLLLLIFLLALFLRLFRLNTYPLGFHVDEAKVAWVSFSILKTDRDDHGNLLALYYNSFGDFRPTGIFYLTIPSLILFGKTNFAVRFPSAFLGALTIFPIYFIALLITKNKKISLISSIFLAIVPWSVTTSRATSEVVISCFLILTSLTLLPKKTKLSFLILILSFLFYHSARVVGPLLMLVWITYLLGKNKIKLSKKIIFGFLITCIFASLLLFSKTGLARFNQVKLPTGNLRTITLNYFSYFDPNFLVGDIAKPFRYRVGSTGILPIPIFLLTLLGVSLIFKSNKNKILLLLLAIGPIPAALTLEDSPNLHRSFFMLPFVIIIAATGFNFLLENHKTFAKLLVITIFISFLGFFRNYFNTNNNSAFEYRDPQAKRLSAFIAEKKNNYDKIFITNDPDSPYPWYAFFNNIAPENLNPKLQNQVNGKWMFENIVWDNTRCPAAAAFDEAKKDKNMGKIMVIDNGMCFTDFNKNHPEAKILKEFSYLDKINYRVWEYIPPR